MFNRFYYVASMFLAYFNMLLGLFSVLQASC